MIQEKSSDQFDSTNLLVFLLKWKKPLIIVSISAAIISAAISLIIPEKFESTYVFFPAYSGSISKGIMTEDAGAKNDIVQFGEEEQAEQMLQILNSEWIRGNVVNKYGLYEHYELFEDIEYRDTKLVKMWEDNVSFKRTEFQSIEIRVLDTDAQMAADIANDVASLVDSAKNKMIHERAGQAFAVVEKEYFAMQVRMVLMDDTLKWLGEKGIANAEKQAEMLSSEYYKAIGRNDARASKALKDELDTLGKYGPFQDKLIDQREFELERLFLLRAKYEELKVDMNQNVSHKFTVNRAWPSEKKAYPIRWLIVVVSTMSAFIFGVLVIIGIENYQRVVSRKES
jgi:capsular polysaccharide biosynthesis protein|tara:strand:- start:1041 stop:2063 length:1023 start_codon:yes stop_codon:yes gene_type:complete